MFLPSPGEYAHMHEKKDAYTFLPKYERLGILAENRDNKSRETIEKKLRTILKNKIDNDFLEVTLQKMLIGDELKYSEETEENIRKQIKKLNV